jgi:hypothetical protein
MMLGDLLAAARDSAGGFQSWLRSSDPTLADEIATAAAHEGLGTASWVRAAVADFSRLASEEDWGTLVSAMRDTDDPGTTCLCAMVHWRLTAPACAHHAGAGSKRP